MAGADDESLWHAACALDCGTFFGRFRIDPATGLQVATKWSSSSGGEEGGSLSGRPPSPRPSPGTRAALAVTVKEGAIDRCPSAGLQGSTTSTFGVGIGAHAMPRVGWGHDPLSPLLFKPVRSPGAREVAVRS